MKNLQEPIPGNSMNEIITYCIYHSRDLDGWMSGAIVKLAIPDVHLIGYDYGQPIPEIPEDADRVIMVDVTFDRPLLEELSKRCQLIIVDHHISTVPKIEGLEVFGTVDTKYAACELCWRYFMTSNTPELVRLLGMYDSFRHKGTDEERYVLEFQYGARNCIQYIDGAYRYLLYAVKCPEDDQETCSNIHRTGSIIYDYLCNDAHFIMRRAFAVSYSGYNFLCVNQERFNPINFGIDYHGLGCDAFISFWYVNDKFLYSIYNDNGKFDCAAFATCLGGGGHKGAAGWQSTEFINQNYFDKCLNSKNTEEQQ